MISFFLSALIMRTAATIQDNIWWKYVDQDKYFEMAEDDGREYLTDVPRPNSYEMGKFDSLVLDFKNLEYISSAGLRVLIATQKKLQPQGIPFNIINTPDSIKEILTRAEFVKFLWNLVGTQSSEEAVNPFTDISISACPISTLSL